MSASSYKMPTVALLVTTPLSVCLERNATRPHDRHVPEQILRTPTREHRGAAFRAVPGAEEFLTGTFPAPAAPLSPLGRGSNTTGPSPRSHKACAVTHPVRTTDS